MTHVTLHSKQLREFTDLDPTLAQVFWTLLNLWPDATMVVTSIGRTWKQDREIGGSGVHAAGPPWRAMDISIRTLTGGQAKAEELAERINEIWQYDPRRPQKPVCYAKPHGTGPHIHLQVHPQTVRRS
jgi:hypothetical protein